MNWCQLNSASETQKVDCEFRNPAKGIDDCHSNNKFGDSSSVAY